MKLWVRSGLLTALLMAGCTDAQVPESPGENEFKVRRFSFGFRVRGFTSDVFDGRNVTSVNSAANTSQSMTTTTSPRHMSAGPAIEVNLSSKLSLQVEAFYHRPSYEKVTRNYSGTDDSSTEADERILQSTVTERTKATYWDFPVTLRYRGFKRRGILSKTFLESGLALRTISNVATGTDTLFADNSTAYNEHPVAPASRNVLGIVAGGGFRFVDDAGIRVAPQVRYVYWPREAFTSDSTRSRRNQLEIGIGLVF